MSVFGLCWSGFSGAGLYWCVSMGILGVCVSGSGWWCVWCVSGVLSLVCCVFNFFVILFASCCSCISVPPAMYDLLWGSGSSVLWGSDKYVMYLSTHGASSPVSTYRRCALDNWSTWR